MTMLVGNALSTFTFWQRREILLTVAGLMMLATGYWGWYRESDGEEDGEEKYEKEWVSFNLAPGGLLTQCPSMTFPGIGGPVVFQQRGGVLRSSESRRLPWSMQRNTEMLGIRQKIVIRRKDRRLVTLRNCAYQKIY